MRGSTGCEVTYTTREPGARSSPSTGQRNRSSYAGNTGARCAGGSLLSEWTTTFVLAVASCDRNVSAGHTSARPLCSRANSSIIPREPKPPGQSRETCGTTVRRARRPEPDRLLDQREHAEHRQVHRDHDHADHAADQNHHQRLDDRG